MKRIVFIIIALLMAYGCATAPTEKKPDDVVFYPAIPAEPRLQFLLSIRSEDDVGSKLTTSFDDFLSGTTKSFKSIGRSWDFGSSKGKIYVLDRDLWKVLIIDLVEKKFDMLRDKRLGKLKDPTGIWITEDDFKYVADSKRKQVVVFGKNNEFIRAYGDKNLFDKPLDVAVYGSSVYVIDFNKHQLFVLNKDTGKHVKTIGEGGVEDGMFYKPTHVTVDHTGNIFVNDAFNFRVQKFDPDGKFIKSYGSLGDGLGNFARPKGLDMDREGHLYVADAAFQNVQIFDEENAELLLYFGGPGKGLGNMYLPGGVHIDYDNVDYFKQYADKDFELKYLVYVGNMLGPVGFNVYGFGKWVGPPLSEEQNTGDDQVSDQKKAE
jgi:DNA-binding beta-propeller fold protein YncE